MAHARPSAEPAEPRRYELVGLVPGSITEKQAQAIIDEVKAHVSAAGATLTGEDLWGKRQLTYRIRGQEVAQHLILHFTADPAALRNLTKTLRLESKLVRFLIVTVPEDYTYISLEQLQARAAEAKEGLAPGLAPKRRSTPTSVRTTPRKEEGAATTPKNLDEKLDKIIQNIDENL